ncbi:MAG: glycosyltransferase family 2 protein [Rhodospirillales bacterium]|nr:glycosyltransferase family 2 protein [Rhodospirillales bacterium]
MSEKSLISVDVIILSWDRMDDTIAAIKSALAQKGVNQKVIIVDQGSQPEGLRRLKEFCAEQAPGKIILICNRENTGVPGGRNQASFAGQGKYIVALDNDAEFYDDRQLANMVQVMESDSTLGIQGFRIMLFDRDEDDKSSWSYLQVLKDFSTKTFMTFRFVGAGHAIRRDAFEKIKGYDDRLFFLHEELDLSRRMLNAGFRIEYNPSVIIRHKVSAERRVTWSGQRFYYDVRNKTYLHIKHKTRFPTMLFHTGLLVMKGFKNGFIWPTLKGLGAALLLIPAAISQWYKDPYINQTAYSKAYMEECSPTSGLSVWEKIRVRFAESNKRLETNR